MSLHWKEWTVVHMLLFVTLLVTGLAINAVQMLLFLTVAPLDRTLFRKLNYYLVWTIYAQILFVADWWSGSQVIIYSREEHLMDTLGKEHGLIVMNHHYELDWLYGWMMADRVRCLGNGRVFLKRVLRYVPIIGWCWSFSDVIYLDRDWDKDKECIATGVRALQEYPHPMYLLIFAEGTRKTKEKFAASREFAQSKGITPLNHHLLPRTKGFTHTIQQADPDKLRAVYDITVCIDENRGHEATLANILKGKKTVAEMFIRRIAVKDIPTEEPAASEWLMQLYREKDDLIENYKRLGTFTKEGEGAATKLILPARHHVLVNTLVLNAIVGYLLATLLWNLALYGSVAQVACAGAVVLTLYVGLRKMMGLTKFSKASAYGSNSAKNKKDR